MVGLKLVFRVNLVNKDRSGGGIPVTTCVRTLRLVT